MVMALHIATVRADGNVGLRLSGLMATRRKAALPTITIRGTGRAAAHGKLTNSTQFGFFPTA
jgi:hypothetical protein